MIRWRLLGGLALLMLGSCAGANAGQPAAADPALAVPLPSPASLRSPSCELPDYFVRASLIENGGDALVSLDDLKLGTEAAPSGEADYSYGIFAQQVGIEPTYISWKCSAGSGVPGPYWIGIANFLHGRWDFFGPYTDGSGNIELTGRSELANAEGVSATAFIVGKGSGAQVTHMELLYGSGDGTGIPPDNLALCVGPGKAYSRIEDALAAAGPNAHIKIYPQAGNAPYEGSALFVDQPGISFWGMRSFDNQRPRVSGTGHEYSGVGSDPRAIFQFQPGADNCRITGLELYDAHNSSYNGAAVRVNQAKSVSIVDCLMNGCDMGLMSNGDAAADTGSLDLVHCRIYDNGSFDDPGYNHNIYAGGTKLRMLGCEVYGSLTGHNVKSRAHINEIIACYIHDSSNREFDLVDQAGNTDIPDSYSLISGCIIEKADPCDGNRNVIHFGQDGGNDHNGTLYLCNNTIITPYVSPVVHFDAANAKLAMYNCILWDGGAGQSGQSIAQATGSADIANTIGGHNWLSSGFSLPAGGSFDAPNMHFGADGVAPNFVDAPAKDYHLRAEYFEFITDGGIDSGDIIPPPQGDGEALTITPADEYSAPYCSVSRVYTINIDLGAHESGYVN